MRIVSVILLTVFSLTVQAQDFTLNEFDMLGQDSIFKCKVLDRYDDFVRYVNNITDQDLDSEIQRHSYIALYRLLASDELGQRGKSSFAIMDHSLEDVNTLYQRSKYLELLENLTKFNYAYEKEFVTHGCIDIGGFQPKTIISTSAGTTEYYSPNLNFDFEFLEQSIKSDTINSSLRGTNRISFLKYVYLKTLKGKLNKLIVQEDYDEYKEEYLSVVTQSKSGDAEAIERKAQLEKKFVKYQLKFNSIKEQPVSKISRAIEDLQLSANDCNCEQKVPNDSDGDGFPDIVDCCEDNPNVYPGARIDCNNNCPDDNCDDVVDLCCIDADGDGFYAADGCDCNINVHSLDIFSKCDCNDNDSTVFPGADINCGNKWSDDNCDGIVDTMQMQRGLEISLDLLDHIYPPLGLSKFGQDGKFYIYSTLIAAGLTSTILHRNKSQHYYQMHRNAVTLRSQNDLYGTANTLHHRYLISAYSTLSVFAFSLVDLKLQYRKYNNIRNDLNQKRRDCNTVTIIELDPLGIQYGYMGPKLCITF